MNTNPKPPKKQLRQRAYTELREMIITLRLRPGTRLDEAAIGEELGIGRTPLREALPRLEAEGLLENHPGQGYFVKEITLDSVRELIETMLIMETAASTLALMNITEEQLAKMESLRQEMGRALRDKDKLRYITSNTSFHQVIYDAANNRHLRQFLNVIQAQAQRLNYLCVSKESDELMQASAKLADEEHENWIAMLRNKDTAGLLEINKLHLRHFHNRICRHTAPTLENVGALVAKQFVQD